MRFLFFSGRVSYKRVLILFSLEILERISRRNAIVTNTNVNMLKTDKQRYKSVLGVRRRRLHFKKHKNNELDKLQSVHAF